MSAAQPAAEHDLSWFFNWSAADLGVRAGPLVPAFGPGASGPWDGEPSESEIKAAGRYRRLEEALYSLSHEHQRTLRLVHERPAHGHPEHFALVGPLAPLVGRAEGDLRLRTWLAIRDEADDGGASLRLARAKLVARQRLDDAERCFADALATVDALAAAGRAHRRRESIERLFAGAA